MTVAQWVQKTEQTGILEFPVLLEIGRNLEARIAELDASWKGKSKECENAWKHQRYWEGEAAKARREVDALRAELARQR